MRRGSYSFGSAHFLRVKNKKNRVSRETLEIWFSKVRTKTLNKKPSKRRARAGQNWTSLPVRAGDSGKSACRRKFSPSPSGALTHTLHTQSGVTMAPYTLAPSDPIRNPLSHRRWRWCLSYFALFFPRDSSTTCCDEDFHSPLSLPQFLLYSRKSITPPRYLEWLIPSSHQRFIFGSAASWHPSVHFSSSQERTPRRFYLALWCGIGREQQAGGTQMWPCNRTRGEQIIQMSYQSTRRRFYDTHYGSRYVGLKRSLGVLRQSYGK